MPSRAGRRCRVEDAADRGTDGDDLAIELFDARSLVEIDVLAIRGAAPSPNDNAIIQADRPQNRKLIPRILDPFAI